MNAAIYLRKSRADSDDESIEETLRRHKETLLDFVKKQPSLNVVKIYEEVVSGDNLYSRPQMLLLLADAEKNMFDSVLCMDIDRLGRGSMSDQGIIINTFKFNNIRILTPRGVFDPNNERDEDSLELETLKARWEYKSIKRRLHNGTIKSIKEGCYLWEAPYGYHNVRMDKKKCTIEIFEEEAKFVRMVFDLYVNSGVGAQTIAYTINAMGAHPHRSAEFNRTSIVSMLKNQVYTGKVVYNKKSTIRKGARGNDKMITQYHKPEDWLVVDGLHPAIIDEETFIRAGEILKSRYHRPYNDGTVVNPLAGLLSCSECGNNMQRRPFNNKKNKTVHLICVTKGCCKSSRLDYVENAVLETIAEKLKELKINRKQHKSNIDYDSILKGLNDELATLQRQKLSLYDFLERGVYDVDTFTNRSRAISERITVINNQCNEMLAKQEKEKNRNPDEIIQKFETVLKLYHQANSARKNALLKSIIESGTYYKEKSWKPSQFSISLNFIDC